MLSEVSDRRAVMSSGSLWSARLCGEAELSPSLQCTYHVPTQPAQRQGLLTVASCPAMVEVASSL